MKEGLISVLSIINYLENATYSASLCEKIDNEYSPTLT